MFRRRPPRRLLRPIRGRIRPQLHAPPELISANQMMETGNYAGAAEQFETLARTDEAHGGRYAPQYYLQAGRARVLGGNNETGLTYLKHGLVLLAERANWLRLHRAGRRILTELEQRGLIEQAAEVSAYLNSLLPEKFFAPQESVSIKKQALPTHCPSCGAALRPDEVEWLDNITAECVYCGSSVRAEN